MVTIIVVLLSLAALAVVSVLLDEAKHRDKHRRLREGATYRTNLGREVAIDFDELTFDIDGRTVRRSVEGEWTEWDDLMLRAENVLAEATRRNRP